MSSRACRKCLWLVTLIIGLISGCSPGSDSDNPESAEGYTTQALHAEAGSTAAEAETAGEKSAATEPGGSPVARSTTPSLAHNANDLIDELRSLSWEKPGEPDPKAGNLLQRLRQQGADAVVPIRDFLLNSEAADSSKRELRVALLELLLSLRLPEVVDIAVELLASQPSAFEAWQLGQYLESVEPGKYTDSIRAVVEQALIEAVPSTVLPAELFLFLGKLGNAETALLLAGLPMHEEAYGRLALASIPDGGGIPILEQDARAFETGLDTVQGRLAVQLLAQQAPQYPEAAAVLLDLARLGVIPHDLWPYVLDIVAGNWELTLLEPAPGDLVGSHTYYHPEGDQVIYRSALHPDLGHDEFQSERLILLERLQPLAPADLRPDEDG